MWHLSLPKTDFDLTIISKQMWSGRWYYLSLRKLQRRVMVRQFHPALYNGCNDLLWINVSLCWYRNQAANTLRPRKNCRRSANGISKCIFLNESVWMSLKVSLKFVRKFWIHNVLDILIQIMTWRRPGDTHYLNRWGLVSDAYMRHNQLTASKWFVQDRTVIDILRFQCIISPFIISGLHCLLEKY